MGMATYLETQLDTALATYVTATSQSMTVYVASLAVGLASLYWLFFGLAAIRGDVSEPMSKITKDVVTMLLVAMVVFTFGNYQTYVIGFFQALVADLTSRMSGGAASSPGALIDAIFANCVTPPGETKCFPVNTVLAHLADKHANSFGIPDLSFFIASILMGLAEIVIVVLCLIPILLSKVGLAIFLAIGSLFIMLAMFPQSRSYSKSWFAGALGNALTLVIVAGICSIVPLIMKRIIDDAFTGDLAGIEVINKMLGALIASLGLGLTALKASQMGSQLAGGGVAMDGGNWLGTAAQIYAFMKGKTSANSSETGATTSAAPNGSPAPNEIKQGSPKSYSAGRAAGNVLSALSRKK